jgi:DNA-binding NtrC family response regulator
VLLLIHHFIQKFSEEYEKPALEISHRALEVMKSYSWPGNVRELENIVQRLVVMTEGNFVDVPDLPSLMRFSAPREPGLQRTLAEVEFEHIKNILSSVGGNKTRAAEILGIDRKTLRDKLKRSDGSK